MTGFEIDYTVRENIREYRMEYGRDPPEMELHPEDKMIIDDHQTWMLPVNLLDNVYGIPVKLNPHIKRGTVVFKHIARLNTEKCYN